MFFGKNILFSQVPCLNVDATCLSEIPNAGSPNDYKCIDVNSIQGSMQNAINQGLLVPASQSATIPQKVVIRGTMSVTVSPYTFAPGSVIIFADQSSGLRIPTNKSLSVKGTYIKGCASIWNQIEVMSSGTFILENTTIKDAYNAVVVNPGAVVSITENTFNRNYIAISFSKPTLPVGTVYLENGGGIWGNIIAGDEFLKAPFISKRPHRGIVLHNIQDLTIGGSIRSVIRDFTKTFNESIAGIESNSSNLTVKNTQFSDVGRSGDVSDNFAIVSGGGTLTFLGLGNADVDEVTISYSNANQSSYPGNGIQLWGANAYIIGTKMENIKNGIIHFRPNTSTPANFLNISHCAFSGFDKNAIDISAGFLLPIKLSSLVIQKCVFDDNAPAVGSRDGISIRSEAPTSGKNFYLGRNVMYHRARPIDDLYKFYGFRLTNINGGKGEGNELFDEGTLFSSSLNGFTGVQMSMCSDFLWHSNTITGNNIPGYNNEYGFEITESPSCYYSCNYIDLLGTGMGFSQDCSASRLTENIFNTHSYASLFLKENGTAIGQQLFRNNQWRGSLSTREAYMEFDGYVPSDQLHINQVRRSLFKIQNPDQNAPLWANPRIVESGGNDLNWFMYGAGSITQSDCYSTLPPDKDMDEIEKGITLGTYSPYNGFAANTWDAEFRLYDKLRTAPLLMASGTDEISWYNGKENSSVGRMARIYRDMISLSEPDATGSPAQLLNDLLQVPVSASHENNLKTVMEIVLKAMDTDDFNLSEEQIKSLGLIAQQCRYQGGWGVAMARNILKRPLVEANDCPPGLSDEQPEDRSDNKNIVSGVQVFPNPAQEVLNVRINTGLTNGQITLRHLTGQVAKQLQINGSTIQMPVSDLQTGCIY